MKAKNKVVYVPPVYEEVQHEATSVDEENNPLRTSFHSDVSLLQRIDNLRAVSQSRYGAKKCLILKNLLLRIKKHVKKLLLLLRRKRIKKRLKKKMLIFSLV